ncbi:MAG: gephyrin-like molybdotransferase Glp, partial [Solirubrobacterales bacterium]
MPAELIEIEEARRLVVERVSPLPAEQVPLREALGRVLAVEVGAADPVPGFDNSAMDGFAVRAADTASASGEAPVTLDVVDESRAGRPAERPVGPGEAMLISTGAMVPK